MQKIIKKWIFMSTITYFYTGSTESKVEKQFADLRNVHTAEEFVDYLDGVISTKFSDDYFNLTLPADLISAAATSPTWFGYIAALNVLGTPMLFSTTTLAAKLLPRASGDKKAIDKHHIFPKNYLTGIGYTSDRDRNQIANFIRLHSFYLIRTLDAFSKLCVQLLDLRQCIEHFQCRGRKFLLFGYLPVNRVSEICVPVVHTVQQGDPIAHHLPKRDLILSNYIVM